MKTKSKRFLNLATLCLALLGTTLLMGHPVKAEEESAGNSTLMSTSEEATGEQDSYIEEQYRNGLSLDKDGFQSHLKEDPYNQYRFEGYKDGYKDGLNPDAEEIDDDALGKKAKEKARDGKHGEGYSDGYESGYSEGWRQGHPIKAFLGFIWSMISSFFFSS
ncbi:hypothetical protein [Streptococcus pyogenes]|uniref:hypothetical protein n=1 Tax=Streptococcus pyogenes TaxID=1314 RepID=UPI0010121309|nr:hypothetical protein [Streptococcus pyogenes]QCK59685.1 hypothetical protein ETT53_07020 [Streptococcus pyogenes]RXS22642.1 hypothetical protein ER610_05435 [Streptococcus pyogenes]VGU41882.1 hypothetical membrane associated protein [Streptococcus pyogenes]